MDVSNFQVQFRVKTEELDEEYNMLPTVKEEVDEDSFVEPKIEFEYGEMCVKMEPEPERLLGPSAKVLAELQQRNLVDPEAGCSFWDEQTDVNDCRDDPEEGRSPVSNDQESGIYGEVLENGCETLTLLNPSSPDEDDPTEFEKVFVYDMHLDKDVSEPDEQAASKEPFSIDQEPQPGCSSWSDEVDVPCEAGLDSTTVKSKDRSHKCKDSDRIKFGSLDSAGIFKIEGKIPMIILKRVDCDQSVLFKSRESLKGKEENDRKRLSTSLVETQIVTGRNSNSIVCKKTRSSHKVNLYTEKDNINENKLVHQKPYLCSMCNYRCSRSDHLKTHMKTHTGEKPFLCSMCNYRCSQFDTLKIHIRTHTGEKPYQCSKCDYKCSHSSYLKRHIRTHTGEKPYLCSKCDYKSSDPSTLRCHSKIHTGEKPYLCSICDYRCSRSDNLKTHMNTHTGEKPFLCSMCDYRCSLSNALKIHMKTHTGEKPYLCSMCDYRCSVSSSLKIHMKTHTGEKPYLCSICDYRCSLSNSLKSHMKTHTGEKPYLCSRCDYSCSHSSSLKTHMKTHTGEKPYLCSKCDYRCSKSCNLKRHMKTHIGMNT